MLLRYFTMLLLSLLLLLLTPSTLPSTLSSGPHITDVNILLPPKMTHPVEYKLQGTGGCFHWTWDHYDFLELEPEFNTSLCSTSARLKSIAPYTGRKETAVYATDVITGMVIRCKVFIDIFSRIQIFHSSVKLDLDGLATLRVRAFDSEENEFSSLVGVQFIWEMIPETDGLPHHLVHVPLKDSPLSDGGGLRGDLDIQVKLEDSGVFSDMYVVKGVETGHEIVSVYLAEPTFERLQDKIILTVAEAMSLDPPSPVFVLIGGAIQYNLKVIRQNIPHVVPLPSPTHRWSVLNSSVAHVDTMTGELHALNLGTTTVIVEDTRVAGHTQTSSLHVVLPDTLVMFIVPLPPSGLPFEKTLPISSATRWYIVSGRKYLIDVKVFSQGPFPREIYISESDDLKLHDDQSKLWSILPFSHDVTIEGSHKILEAFGYGIGKLMATLTYRSGLDESKEVMKVVQEVMVCDQVKFSFNKGNGKTLRILLPWAPSVNQEFELKVTGGCGMESSDYLWFSSDVDVVSVSATGIIQSKGPGKATIKAASTYDRLNYDEILVEISLPSLMVMMQNFPTETPVGSHLPALVTLKGPGGANFDRCDAFNSIIKWRTEDENFSVISATGESNLSGKLEMLELGRSSASPVCSWTYVYASKPGRTVLHAALTKDNWQLNPSLDVLMALKASREIAAYTPLIVHQMSDGNQFGGYWFNLSDAQALRNLRNLEYLYLAPSSGFDVMLHGGPEKWDQGVEYIETLEIFDEVNSFNRDGVVVHQVFSDYGTLYRVMCAKFGTFKLVFKRGNLIGDSHPMPAVSEVQLSLICRFPFSVAVLVDEAVNSHNAILSSINAERSEDRMHANPITVANGQRIRVSAVGVSDTGEAFGNSSSLRINWELGNCSEFAFLDDAYNLAKTKSSWERFLVLQNVSGFCSIRATVVGFHSTICQDCVKALPESPENALTDAVSLHIVSSLRVVPEYNLLYFSDVARMNLSVAGGSCSLKTLVNDSQIVEVVQLPPDLKCLQLMLTPKMLGTALVTVYDIGLAPPLVASSVVQVADVDWIQITSGERMSLMKGNSLSISFLAGIQDGHVFDSSQYVYMNISVHIDNRIVEIVDDYTLAKPKDEYVKSPSFTIEGTHLGVTTLSLSTRQHSGDIVFSQSIKVEVYEPPIIHPSDIFLVPGASYVLTVRGGPKFGAHVEYACMDDKTAKVDMSSGRLSAVSPGNSTIVATFYGNGDILICQAYGKVLVGVPSSALLNVQSDIIAVGRKLHIFPHLSEGNLFSFHELCNNYEWTVEDEEVLGFLETKPLQGSNHNFTLPSAKFGPSDYLEAKNLGFLKVLQGRSPGKTIIRVSFTCDFSYSASFSESRFYTAFTSLRVLSDLPLALGSTITWVLPPYYTSSELLPLSANTRSEGDAVRRKGIITYSLLGRYSKKSGEVQDDVAVDGGKIKTKEPDSLACIEAKDRSTGRAEVASCVRVAEVAQARIIDEGVLVISLAVGSELDLTIRYYDFLGNPFHEAYNVTLFEAETNHRDIVAIEQSCNGDAKVHLRAISKGKALVQIAFTNNPQKSDYVMILVGAHLHPLNPVLHPGSRLNFSIGGLNSEALGQWFSANESILYVDMSSGVAEAVGEGSTQIYYQDSNLKLQTKVTVLKGTLVSVDAPKERLTNAPPFPAKGYIFPVRLDGGDYNYTFRAVGNGKILFDCKVNPPYVGLAESRRDLNTGMLYCIFFPYSPEHLLHFLPTYGKVTEQIPISMHASLLGETNVSGSASALFTGGFSVLEMKEKSVQLNLNQSTSRSFITIVGNTDVDIIWEDRVRLSVGAINGEIFSRGGRAIYEVKVIGVERLKDKLIITLPATGQRMEVDVSYEPERTVGVSHRILVAFIVGAVLLLVIPIMMYWMLKDRGVQPHSGPVVMQAIGPTTPIRGSPQATIVQSPRTPQPFLDYVRRTIDETPNYRQDFRRRVNPGYTY